MIPRDPAAAQQAEANSTIQNGLDLATDQEDFLSSSEPPNCRFQEAFWIEDRSRNRRRAYARGVPARQLATAFSTAVQTDSNSSAVIDGKRGSERQFSYQPSAFG